MTTVRTFTVAAGDTGAAQTLRLMARLVNAALVVPLVVNTAKSIVAACGPGDDYCNALALGGWLLDRFRFVRDPRGVEVLHEPAYMLQVIDRQAFFEGDCDDAAILGAAVGKAVGLRARFRALSFASGGPLTHVIADLRTPRGWVQLDVTRPAQFPLTLKPDRAVTVEV